MGELLDRSALLLVDCQHDFIDPPAALKRIGMLGSSAEDRVASSISLNRFPTAQVRRPFTGINLCRLELDAALKEHGGLRR